MVEQERLGVRVGVGAQLRRQCVLQHEFGDGDGTFTDGGRDGLESDKWSKR